MCQPQLTYDDWSSQRWRGKGTNEEGINVDTGKVIVKVDTNYFRPAEVEYVSFYLIYLSS